MRIKSHRRIDYSIWQLVIWQGAGRQRRIVRDVDHSRAVLQAQEEYVRAPICNAPEALKPVFSGIENCRAFDEDEIVRASERRSSFIEALPMPELFELFASVEPGLTPQFTYVLSISDAGSQGAIIGESGGQLVGCG